MPPHPRNSPSLEVAKPGETTRRDTGWHQDESANGWEVMFGDGEWHPVDVRGWWTDDRHRKVIQIEWHAEMSTWGETCLFDVGKVRERPA